MTWLALVLRGLDATCANDYVLACLVAISYSSMAVVILSLWNQNLSRYAPRAHTRPPLSLSQSHWSCSLSAVVVRLQVMSDASAPPPCPVFAPESCPQGWLPRGNVETMLCEEYSGGLYQMPCYLPFVKLPRMFLFCLFASIVGLALLVLCNCICKKNSAKRGGVAAGVK